MTLPVKVRAAARFGACLGVALAIAALAAAGARATDIREFVHDTQQMSTAGQRLTLVWWLPPEFWDVSLANNPNVPPETAAQIRASFKDYQVFAVARVTTGLQGLTELQSKADLLGNARFDVGGTQIAPLAPDKIPPGMQVMLGAMRPMLANMLGQMGQSMELIVYPGVVDQQRLLDPLKAGTFQYSLYDQTFRWHTPLASLLPKKVDPKTHEEFPGNYDYNPFTGDRLRLP